MNTIVVFFTFLCFGGINSEEIYEASKNSLKPSTCADGYHLCREFLASPQCSTSERNVWKRSTRQDEMGPFWANRGKKDPMYTQTRLFAEEPHWKLVRRDDERNLNYDPFFTTRGKRLFKWFNDNSRDRRNPVVVDGASPFLAARGKKESFDREK